MDSSGGRLSVLVRVGHGCGGVLVVQGLPLAHGLVRARVGATWDATSLEKLVADDGLQAGVGRGRLVLQHVLRWLHGVHARIARWARVRVVPLLLIAPIEIPSII